MLKAVLSFAATGLVGTVAVAAGLALWPWPGSTGTAESGLDFSQEVARAAAPLGVTSARMRDGGDLALRHVPGPDGAPLVVMLHGSGWHGMQFEALAARLQGKAEMVIPDLRGHGVAPARRGDVDYIGQYEDDLADLIAAYAKPGQKVVMLGHSSGGGLVVRFAGGAQGGRLDGAVLLAPFLQHDAPTTRKNSGGWATVNLRRVIGLTILNALHITALNGLPVIRFAMPKVVLDGPMGPTATTEYSFRLNSSFSPRRDWAGDVARLPVFLVVAGTADEAFVAEAYEPTLSAYTSKGRYVLVPQVGHLAIVQAQETADQIVQFLDTLK